MLLAVDTSTRRIGLALYEEDGVLHEAVWSSPNYHTMQLAPAVEEALAKAGFAITDLEAIAIATGPGSFTGLRIGMAFAKGLALARRIALVGIPSLDVLAAGQPLKQLPMAAVLRAGRGRLAVGWYQAGKKNWEATGQLDVFTAESLAEQLNEPTLVCGELAVEERRTLRRNRRHVILASPAWSVRRPAFLAELAWVRWQAGRTDDPTSLSPIYLHYNDPIAS
jgi:tRNA threonylcarbamoyladenosine biosynthesis protein TsaB